MKKALKYLALISSFALAICLILAGILYLFGETQVVSIEEREKLKSGKQFFQWHSPDGPLNIHYMEKGKGDHHVLLLHGFRSHSYTWKALIPPLVEKGYHVWAIDLIGFGLSDKPNHVNYTPDFFVEQTHAFMEEKEIKSAHLIGNSMGGGLALSIALMYPKKVQSLTLLDALGYCLDMPLYLSLSKQLGQIWAPLVCPTMIRYGLEQIIFDKTQVLDEKVEAYCLPYRFPGGVTASILTLQQFDNDRLIEMARHYPSLKYPTLIIWGDSDKLIPISHYDKFVADFPHAEKLLITNCGHIPQEEAPDQVLAALFNFFDNTEAKGQKPLELNIEIK